MNNNRTYISFDWALKRLLRDKANFKVLEGFISTLLNEEVKIDHLLESESNKDEETQKSNRVDLLAVNSKGELLLVEVQGESEYAYFQRILFGTSKLVTEYINSGQNYEHHTSCISTWDRARTSCIMARQSFAAYTKATCCNYLPSSGRSSEWMRCISSIRSTMC